MSFFGAALYLVSGVASRVAVNLSQSLRLSLKPTARNVITLHATFLSIESLKIRTTVVNQMAKTIKNILVTFSDGKTYAIPALVIHRLRSIYYAAVDGISVEEALEQEKWVLQDKGELISYMQNNLDWKHLKSDAVLQTERSFVASYEEEFTNADTDIEYE